MRIAVLTDQHSVNSEYRSFPLLELHRLGHEVDVHADREHIDVGALSRADVVHIYRYRGSAMARVTRLLRRQGVAVVWDSDDDHALGGASGMPDAHADGSRGHGRVKRQMVEMMELADVVTVASDALAERYRSWGAEPVHVVENYLPRRYASSGRRRREKGVVVGWTAALEHRFDNAQLGIGEVLERLLDRRRDLRVVTVGIDLELNDPRYSRLPLVQYHDLCGHVSGFDVGIAPIADIPFNVVKSNVKPKEYAAAGVPWLASPVGPYRDLGESQGGRLVADGSWLEAVDELLSDRRGRRRLAKAGARWAEQQTVAANLDVYELPLREALARAQTR